MCPKCVEKLSSIILNSTLEILGIRATRTLGSDVYLEASEEPPPLE